ncbi:uncharacterized protein LOC129001018 [Macrosteles quadrilineatus]|nr:uncharacterized protein LOC129001018 [Macrosteles quadrilineatus]
MKEVSKKIKLMSHESGPNCLCRLKCFESVPKETRVEILKNFNLLETHDLQNSYLCGLITVLPVRRPTKNENARKCDAVYKYKIRGLINGKMTEQIVCKKAFIAIHGISKKKIEYLVRSLKLVGVSPKDKRGKHNNRPHKLTDDEINCVKSHISSFKGRSSHYGLHDSNKLYLPEELNVVKMHMMFKEKFPTYKVSYESYRKIFCESFNIAFGYPRTDTCSICDQFTVKVRSLELELKNAPEFEKANITLNIRKLNVENEVHKRKAEQFYSRKRQAKRQSKVDDSLEAICIDYGKNLQVPNIPTNDIYYKRQLSVYAFNVHVLSDARSVFYMYPQTEGGKGSDEVCTFVHHFVYNYLDENVKHLRIFADSCAGQQKNFTFFRFLFNLVNYENKLESVTVTFPIRGHSYMENDKNMGLINTKSRAEVPEDWVNIVKESRRNPSHFEVEVVDHEQIKGWTKFLDEKYATKCPFKSRPIRELHIVRGQHVQFRKSYFGALESASIYKTVPNRGRKKKNQPLPPVNVGRSDEFNLPDSCYKDCLPLKEAKYKDLQDLKKFCSPSAAEYFEKLLHE